MEVTSSAVRSLIEPLIDLMHGDIVLEDPCCRHIASSFISAHESALRELSASHALPAGLEKAIETYCVRRYLLCGVEVLSQSPAVLQNFQKLATTLTAASLASVDGDALPPDAGSGGENGVEVTYTEAQACLVAAGSVIEEALSALAQNQQSDAQWSCLLEGLSTAVLGHIMHACLQCAQQAAQYLDGAAWQHTPLGHLLCRASLQRFVASALEHRAARARAVAAAQEATVQELLFGQGHVEDEGEAGPSTEETAVQSPVPPSGTDFFAEVRAAMDEATVAPIPRRSPAPAPTPKPAAAAPPPPTSESMSSPRSTPPLRHTRTLLPLWDSAQEVGDALGDFFSSPTAERQGEPADLNLRPSGPDRHDEVNIPEAPLHVHNANTPDNDIDVTPSPTTVTDPSVLTVEMSAVVASPLQGTGDEEGSSQSPPRKARRADSVLIGASETSVLRMLESAEGVGHATYSYDSASSSLPPCAQPPAQQLIGGTPIPPVAPLPAEPVVAPGEMTSEEPAVDLREEVRRCLQRQEAESRTYFLCASTQRFEPLVAKGFFSCA